MQKELLKVALIGLSLIHIYRLELAFYDRCMLDEIAEQMNADVSDFHKYDEKPGNRLLSRRVGNHTNSYEEIIAQFQMCIRDRLI